MIGVSPPGHFGYEPEKNDEQLEYYANLWAKDLDKVVKRPDLIAAIRNVQKKMPDSWYFFPIDSGKVKVATFISLYHRAGAAKVFDAYIAAANGDYSGLAFMSLAYDFALPSSVIWGDFISKSYSADFDLTRDYFNEIKNADSIIGSPIGLIGNTSIQFGNWPMKQISDEFRQLQISNVETLIISGSIDFSTPVEYSTDELLPYFNKGK